MIKICLSPSAAPGSNQTARWCPSVPGGTAAPAPPCCPDPRKPDRASPSSWRSPLDSCLHLKLQTACAGVPHPTPFHVLSLYPDSLHVLHPELHPEFGRGSSGPPFESVEVWREGNWWLLRQKSGFLCQESWEGMNTRLYRVIFLTYTKIKQIIPCFGPLGKGHSPKARGTWCLGAKSC